MTQTLNSILILYSWVVAAVLVLFLFLIGRFCETKLGQKSNYRYFLVPLALFLIAAVWYAGFARDETGVALNDFVGAIGPDLLYLAGGLILIVLCHSLYRAMIGGNR